MPIIATILLATVAGSAVPERPAQAAPQTGATSGAPAKPDKDRSICIVEKKGRLFGHDITHVKCPSQTPTIKGGMSSPPGSAS